jgi:hypothetical protein
MTVSGLTVSCVWYLYGTDGSDPPTFKSLKLKGIAKAYDEGALRDVGFTDLFFGELSDTVTFRGVRHAISEAWAHDDWTEIQRMEGGLVFAYVLSNATTSGSTSSGRGYGPRTVPEGMASPGQFSRSANFERHVNEFLGDWRAEPVLNEYVGNRMRQLGVKPSQIGIVDEFETGTPLYPGAEYGGQKHPDRACPRSGQGRYQRG